MATFISDAGNLLTLKSDVGCPEKIVLLHFQYYQNYLEQNFLRYELQTKFHFSVFVEIRHLIGHISYIIQNNENIFRCILASLLQGVSQQLPRKKSTQFIDEKGYEKNEYSIPEVIHCSFVGDSVLSTVSSFKTLVKANSHMLIFKKLKSILDFIIFLNLDK